MDNSSLLQRAAAYIGISIIILFWPTPATSLYECEAGQTGFVAVSDHQGSPQFWIAKSFSTEVDYNDIVCFLSGSRRIMVLNDKEKET